MLSVLRAAADGQDHGFGNVVEWLGQLSRSRIKAKRKDAHEHDVVTDAANIKFKTQRGDAGLFREFELLVWTAHA